MDCKVKITIENTIKVDPETAKGLSKQEFKNVVRELLEVSPVYVLSNAIIDVDYTLHEGEE